MNKTPREEFRFSGTRFLLFVGACCIDLSVVVLDVYAWVENFSVKKLAFGQKILYLCRVKSR
jgi:hypothetical protein